MIRDLISIDEFLHFHMCGGLAGAAKGFNRGQARVGNLTIKARCIGGIDVDPGACRDFTHAAGVAATCMDLFDRDQYVAFHGKQPPTEWREATPEDIRKAAHYERPNCVFISAPCKGFSGLLSESKSKGPRYQALNRLTLRCVWLMLEAWSDNPPEFILFENVPRIQTRGADLLERITQLLQSYGYAVAPTNHDCGELGGLAQSRRRFLLVARHTEKIPPFLYEPQKRPLRGVGEILGKMPLPGDPRGGPMHTIPRLHWKTWVRLAFVEAGSDWRSLNKLRVVDGKLADYLLLPETLWEGAGRLGVTSWNEAACTVAGASRPDNGKFSVADPRSEIFKQGYGVADWALPSRTVQGESLPSNGEFSVADPRFEGAAFSQWGVRKWEEPAGTVTAQSSPGQGPISIADPRIDGIRHNNVFRIVRWDEHSQSVTAGGHPTSGGQAVADPRPPDRDLFRKYHVTPWDRSTGTVIGGHHSEEGAYAVADPRPDWENRYGNLNVAEWDKPSNTVIAGGKGVQGGWLSIADPRTGLQRERGDNYLTAGQYGVIPWSQPSGAVSGAAQHDSGRWSVADPRMPEPNQKLVCMIRSLDNTWHRPFTTLELAALQSLVDPDEYFDLDGVSDSAKRERIGNAVPPAAAEAIANVMCETLLLARSGHTFQLSATPIWVRPIVIALSVKTEVR